MLEMISNAKVLLIASLLSLGCAYLLGGLLTSAPHSLASFSSSTSSQASLPPNLQGSGFHGSQSAPSLPTHSFSNQGYASYPPSNTSSPFASATYLLDDALGPVRVTLRALPAIGYLAALIFSLALFYLAIEDARYLSVPLVPLLLLCIYALIIGVLYGRGDVFYTLVLVGALFLLGVGLGYLGAGDLYIIASLGFILGIGLALYALFISSGLGLLYYVYLRGTYKGLKQKRVRLPLVTLLFVAVILALFLDRLGYLAFLGGI